MNKDVALPSDFFELNELDCEYQRVTENIHLYEEEYVIDIIFRYYRKHGFPGHNLNEYERRKEMNRLLTTDFRSLVKDDVIVRSMVGLRLAWHYFPHCWNVPAGPVGVRTPLQKFLDDDSFKAIIKKSLYWVRNYSNNNRLTKNRLLQKLKYFGNSESTQAVSNFRPTAAGVIYELFGGNGVTWDMSCGWGGRLLGAISSNKIKKYIGTDPSSKTYNGLVDIKNDFSYLNTDIELYKLGAEDFIPDKDSIDLCFTSPPYFDVEKYSEEESQSYVKFPSLKLWVNGFLKQMIENCKIGLKDTGILAINISDSASNYGLENKTKEICRSLEFCHINTMKMQMSSFGGKKNKYEPIFIFKKGE